MLTPYGYEVDDLPPLMSAEEFNQATADAYAEDPRLASALASVSALIRMYCRWHIAPNITCEYRTSANGRYLQVPALAVTEILSVTEDGNALTPGEYTWRREGLIRRACFRNWTTAWGGIGITYKAGFDTTPPEVAEIILNRVTGDLSLPYGVKSESAGGVSISYAEVGYNGGLSPLEAMTLAAYALPTGTE